MLYFKSRLLHEHILQLLIYNQTREAVQEVPDMRLCVGNWDATQADIYTGSCNQ